MVEFQAVSTSPPSLLTHPWNLPQGIKEILLRWKYIHWKTSFFKFCGYVLIRE